MTRWWHGLAQRPLGAHRIRAFTTVACLLLLVAAGLVVATDRTPPAVDDEVNAPAVAVAPVIDRDGTAAPVERGAVVRRARRFLRGYLAYLYGHGAARAVGGSTPALRRRLEKARLRVPPAARRRHPRVVRLTTERMSGDRWHVVATVADGGVARYPVELLITASERGLRVAEVSSE